MFAALDSNKDKGNSGASGLSMAEAYRYFAGGAPYAGNNKDKTDYNGNTAMPTGPIPPRTLQSQAAMAAIIRLLAGQRPWP